MDNYVLFLTVYKINIIGKQLKSKSWPEGSLLYNSLLKEYMDSVETLCERILGEANDEIQHITRRPNRYR